MTREEAILCLKGMKNYARDTFTEQTDWQDSLDIAIEALKAEPIKRGRWEQVEVVHDRKDAKIQDWQQAKCSVCGKWHTTPFMYYLKLDNYCPNCGADMRGGEE